MAFEIHRQTQLGADAISSGDQHRLAVFLRQRTQRAKATQSTHHFRAAGFLYYAFNTVNQIVTSININTGVFVAERGFVGHCGIPTRLRLVAKIKRGNSTSAGKRLRVPSQGTFAAC